MIINVLEYLENSEKTDPEKVVFGVDNQTINYSGLVENARKIGTCLINELHGVRREPIVVFVNRNIESLVSFMAIAYSGNFYVPVDMQMPKMRIELILETLKPVAAIVLNSDLEYSRRISYNLLTIIYEEALKYPIQTEKLMAVRRTAIDTDPIYATFTSGSTGIPKGVITCHRSVIDMTEEIGRAHV